MDKNFTPKSPTSVNKKSKAIASVNGPKESTLDFLRTFARFYAPNDLGNYTKAAWLN